MPTAESLGHFEQLVLTAVLALEDDGYGVTIHQRVNDLASPRRIGLGAVYVTLDRLEDKGLVRSWLSEPTPARGGRARRHYRLEAAGRRALHDSLAAARRMYDVIANARGTRWKPVRQN